MATIKKIIQSKLSNKSKLLLCLCCLPTCVSVLWAKGSRKSNLLEKLANMAGAEYDKFIYIEGKQEMIETFQVFANNGYYKKEKLPQILEAINTSRTTNEFLERLKQLV